MLMNQVRALPALMILPLLLAFGLLAHPPAQAHEGHDHAEPAAATATGPAAALLPRAETHSELFELLVLAEGQELQLYLDRWDSNEPVTDASIEIESGAWKAQAKAGPDGVYRVAHQLPPGEHGLSFTIQAGEAADLLETSLRLSTAGDHTDDEKAGLGQRGRLFGAAAVLALLVLPLLWLLRRRRRTRSLGV
jgi:hypothetical protein